eukprot:Tbor_TRINITY_DN8234_c0_g1::TRINITY_DN8234_c0_g1_i1::g.15376::m.15376
MKSRKIPLCINTVLPVIPTNLTVPVPVIPLDNSKRQHITSPETPCHTFLSRSTLLNKKDNIKRLLSCCCIRVMPHRLKRDIIAFFCFIFNVLGVRLMRFFAVFNLSTIGVI